ncbi:PP2C family serine/threonine-protein phosphatase [Roseibium sp. RKSG952]|uniref:PP2C family protein-serine/threonine phosphatase n=1 Tax=Roseibium sp. RKSG952 TaxID=2529384 RepID=UPI0012BD10C8|nr:protein phosphatase 2C domain-containing protein [Roseibium sp. RKSG952]MTH98024.1 serine/threonine-protein phosphatase [Roseibium sp. RKSG952]
MTQSESVDQRRFGALTHIGHVRQVNEDSILCRPDLGLWVVADGMGGHAGGDFASRTVVAALDRLPRDLEPSDVMREARKALQEAHESIQSEAARRQSGVIGSTVVLVVLSEQHFMCLWAGDSRLYRLRNGVLEMISLDHSIVGEFVEQGYITWDQAKNYPNSNQITRAVGVGDMLEIDKRRGDIRQGDRFLLCSDGLSEYLTSAELQAHLENGDVEQVPDRLLSIALEGGGADNISIIAIEV